MAARYHGNHLKLLISNIGNGSTFSLGVYFVFMLSQGLSIAQISLVISAQLIIIGLGSLAGGIFADRYGYKKALIYGCFLFLVGATIVAFGKNFISFLIGFSAMGLGFCFKGGSQSALLYIGLQQDGNQDQYKRVAGKIELFSNIFLVASSIVGGFLYVINHRLPFYAEILVTLICFISVMLLKNPRSEKQEAPILHQLKNAFTTTFNKPKFSKVFLFSALIGSIALTAFQYLQPLYKTINIPEASFGFIAAILFVMQGFGSWYSNRLGSLFSVDKYLVLHAATFGLFLAVIEKLNSAYLLLPILAVLYFLRGLYNPTVSTYINDRVEPSQRATILSVNNQLITFVSSLALAFTGFVASNYGLPTVFLVISSLSMIFLISYVVALRKVETG